MKEKPELALPPPFLERMKLRMGCEYDDFISSYKEDLPVAIRINPGKWSGILPGEKVPWCNTGFYLRERPSFTADPWFHGGTYYVQEPGSMFLEQAIRQARLTKPALVLDLCAAPGGKSTHLLSLIEHGDLLVANEMIRSRTAVLQENLLKWGHPNVVVTNNDPQDFGRMEPVFDLILVDAPCSGEGLFRKDPSAVSEWSIKNTELCAARQKRILAEAWKCLKPGGTLVYSTCTFNPAENEENIQWLCNHSAAYPVEIETDPAWNIENIRYGNINGYQVFPHRTKGEGFFTAAVRKPGIPGFGLRGKHMLKKWMPVPKQITVHPEKWITPGFSGVFLTRDDVFTVFPAFWLSILAMFEKNLNVLRAGTSVASWKNNRLIPSPALAWSLILKRSAFNETILELPEAIRFLQKENLVLPYESKGWLLTSWKDVPLGWLNNLGHRTNNYYPREWRIRMQIGEVPVPWHERY